MKNNSFLQNIVEQFRVSITFLISLALIGSISGNLERALERAGGSGWNYAGQGNYWPVTHPYCGGKRQSPINIDNSKVFNTNSATLNFRYPLKPFSIIFVWNSPTKVFECSIRKVLDHFLRNIITTSNENLNCTQFKVSFDISFERIGEIDFSKT